MREFFDIETHEFITETEILEEFIKLSYENVTFEQYMSSRLFMNGGTLLEV